MHDSHFKNTDPCSSTMAKPSTCTNTIIEEREELMVSLIGDSKPILRMAHFLSPTAASINEPEAPSDALSPLPPAFKPTKWPLKVTFGAWRQQKKDWNAWVCHLQSMHQSAWKKAGIYDAIMSSTYDIRRYDAFLFGLAEKWCPNTNTFVFPWAEATITLEDVMILGGYSVLGSPVSCSVQNREWKIIEEALIDARAEVLKSKANKACQCVWMKKFFESGSDIEHEAFLSLWLSRFVFQTSSGTIRKEFFPIAIRLARGIPVALAPAVLASIYRDLSHLKRAIVSSVEFGSGKDNDNGLTLHIFSPFQLVQLWAWERFQGLQQKPNLITQGDPRSARWDKAKICPIENVRMALHSAGESFLWRPYTKIVQNWHFPKFYKGKEELVPVDSELDKDLESFARCLRVSKLVGIECMEHYFPHRVAMQFGMDQDLPGCVAKFTKPSKVAWTNYCEPISSCKLYIPSRLFESAVTTRYLKWWKELVLGQQEPMKEPVEQQKCLDRSKSDTQASKEKHKDRDPDVPPGFCPKYNMVEVGNSVEGDKPAVLGLSSTCNKHDGLSGQCQCCLAAFAHDGAVKHMGSIPKLAEKILHGEVAIGAPGTAMEGANERMTGNLVYNRVGTNGSGIPQSHPQASQEKKKNRDPDVPPGFPPKCNTVEERNSVEGDKPAGTGILGTCIKDECSRNKPIGNGYGLSGQSRSSLASFTHNGDVRKIGSVPELAENILHGKVPMGRSGRTMEGTNGGKAGNLTCERRSINGSEGGDSSPTLEMPWMAIEARIRRLESETAKLKAARFGHRLQ